MFRITYLPADRRLWVESKGFWDFPTSLAFQRELGTIFDAIILAGWPIRLLSDARDFATQAAKVAEVLKETAVQMRDVKIDRWAVVQPNTLQRLQLRRTASNHVATLFETIDDAMAWLEWPASQRPSSIADACTLPTTQSQPVRSFA